MGNIAVGSSCDGTSFICDSALTATEVGGSVALGTKVQVAATEILRVAGVVAYHTSVVLGGREYYFDSQGIMSGPSLWSHLAGKARRRSELRTEVHAMGVTRHGGADLVRALRPFFQSGSYDVLHKNCNAFTDAAAYFLTGCRADGRFSRLERMLVAAEPLSTGVLNKLLRAAAAEGCSDAQAYTPNPLAQGFSVEDVIGLWDTLDDEGIAFDDEAGGAAWTCGHDVACGRIKRACCGVVPASAPSVGSVGGHCGGIAVERMPMPAFIASPSEPKLVGSLAEPRDPRLAPQPLSRGSNHCLARSEEASPPPPPPLLGLSVAAELLPGPGTAAAVKGLGTAAALLSEDKVKL
jgi:hypothetical protein